MYQLVEKKLVELYKDNNKFIVRSVLLFVVLLSPLLVMYAPLPGYLLLTSQILSPSFVITLSLVTGLSWICTSLYQSILSQRYFFWAISVFGRSTFFRHYYVGSIKFCIPVFFVLAVGLTKVDLQMEIVARVLMLVGSQLIWVFWLTNYKFNCFEQSERKDQLVSSAFFILSALKQARLLVLMFVVTLLIVSLLSTLALSLTMLLVIISLASLVTLPICYRLYFLMSNRFSQDALFFHSISNQYYLRQRFIFRFTMCAFPLIVIALPLILFCLMGIRAIDF